MFHDRHSFSDAAAIARGRFTLDIFRDGTLEERVDEANLVVVGAETLLAGLLGGVIAGPGVTQIGYGASLVAPSYGNTALTTPFLRPIDGATYPAAGQVAFAFSLGSGDANGLSIGEFGLLSAAGLLFARKVRTVSPIPKDATISLAGTWTITF